MNTYQQFLEALYLVAKKLRLQGVKSIARHVDAPAESPILAPVAPHQPEASFMFDSLAMLAAGMSVEELTFYMDGYRHRLITHDKADIHLVNLVFRTVWAIAHSAWDPLICTEFGRATVPAGKIPDRLQWVAHCGELEVERTRANINWDQMLGDIKTSG